MTPARADEKDFSDPARVTPPPAHAIGFPSRSPSLDAAPGFHKPPAGYGDVGFYWWLGDPLTKDRIQWQIDQLADKGVMGLQINYAHSDKGGHSYGLTYESDPKLFSKEWWELEKWFVQAAKAKGMAVSLSDYTLGFGQGYYIDEILHENPDLGGANLLHVEKTIDGNTPAAWQVHPNLLCLTAYKLDGERILPESAIDLREHVNNTQLRWAAPQGKWKICEVWFNRREFSLDPMNPKTGPKIIEKFFQRFEDASPGEAGKGLNFFFSDELTFGVDGNLWNDQIAAEFTKRKGYNLLPELAALFVDTGPRAPKVRLDYRDVMVSLIEEGYFKPLFDWHQQRGMIYGCDHGGRGRRLDEFGDYFRTQRWNQGPGSDQPRLSKDLIKAKVAASIAHLYERPRVWIEGYYSSGWGTSSAQIADATFANFAHGYNLLTFHGLYYSTHGGYWEWAPPCNHFHMPYWHHMKTFLDCSQRLSYLLSQGHHVCDVAIMYPVASVEAQMGAKESVDCAFAVAQAIYDRGIDFDFLDFQSLARAEMREGKLQVAGESYRALVLPSMQAARFSTLEKARDFHRAGGIVIAVGELPKASERVGRDDPQIDAILKEIFGDNLAGSAAGRGIRVQSAKEVDRVIHQSFPADYKLSSVDIPTAGHFMHRKVGPRDVYFLYNIPAGAEVQLRATGQVERWDPWTGQSQVQPVVAQTDGITTLRLDEGATTPYVIVLSPGQPSIQPVVSRPAAQAVSIDGPWEFELKPSLDNRYGDYVWPPTNELLGPEIRQIKYHPQTASTDDFSSPTLDDSAWPKVTQSFGPRFWKLGPLPDNIDSTALEATLSALKQIDPRKPVKIDGKSYNWSAYSFSWRWGLEGDPGHEGYHGLKSEITDEFIALGKKGLVKHSSVYTKDAIGSRYYLWTSVVSDQDQQAQSIVGGSAPSTLWINGQKSASVAGPVQLRAGANPVLIRYDHAGRSYFVVGTQSAVDAKPLPIGALKMRWHENTGVLPFDLTPENKNPTGWYRFASPPGLAKMTLTVHGSPTLYIDGRKISLAEPKRLATGAAVYDIALQAPQRRSVSVALRIEQPPGQYAGAVFPEPIKFKCIPGELLAGDWSANDGLHCYSGGAWYRQTITLPAELVGKKVTLDLGQVVSTAEVIVNAKPAGTLVAPPWTLDVSKHLQAGENRVEILIYSTLGNHYTTIPSMAPGSPTAGLLGPVRLTVEK